MIKSTTEAFEYFIKNATPCMCLKSDGQLKQCKTLPEAIAFFKGR